jgi:hypothetical protein
MTPTEGKLTARQVRHKRIVSDAIQGKRYTEIARENGLNPKYPRQDVYRIIHSPKAQAEMQAIANKVEVTVDTCLDKLAHAYSVADKRKNPVAMTGAVMAQAKLKGLLIDYVADVSDRVKLKVEAEDTLSSLGVSSMGIATLGDPGASLEQCEPNAEQVKADNG